VTAPPPEDRYLSASTLHEAAAVLEGLAGLLDRVDGVFADDAAADARHLRDLAATLSAWWPHPDVVSGATAMLAMPRRAWEDLLSVYVAHGLRIDRGEAPEGSAGDVGGDRAERDPLARGGGPVAHRARDRDR
jgi:hypothetical protein